MRPRALAGRLAELGARCSSLEELEMALGAVLAALSALVLLTGEVLVAIGTVEVIAVEANFGVLALGLHRNDLTCRTSTKRISVDS